MKIQYLNKFLFSSGKFIRIFYIDPLMLFTQHHFFRDYSIGKFVPPNIFKEKECYLFSADNWYWKDTKYRVGQHQLILDGYQKFVSEYSNVKVIFMHPDEGCIEGYPNIPYVIFNRNAMLDPNDYFIQPNQPKVYDAIYNANFYRYKRHELISKLSNVGLIYYLRNEQNRIHYINDEEMIYGQQLRTQFQNNPNVTLLNDIYGSYKFLSKREICEFYNQSYCGLCLSDVEGACLVSMEYLLSGLPVVSTKNIGGRDVFLKDAEYAIIDLNDDSNDIHNAVDYFKKKKFNSEQIVEETLYKIDLEWIKLFLFISSNISKNVDYHVLKHNLINIWKDYCI